MAALEFCGGCAHTLGEEALQIGIDRAVLSLNGDPFHNFETPTDFDSVCPGDRAVPGYFCHASHKQSRR